MASDAAGVPRTLEKPQRPAIENEIPTYKKISATAVVSFVLGIASVLSFTDLIFLVAAVAAVVTGAVAARRIRSYPDELTGRGLAHFGLAAGLVCGLSSSTMAAVSHVIVKRELTRFAKEYVVTLQDGTLADAVWYKMPPGSRKGKSPSEMLASLRTQSGEQRAYEMVTSSLVKVKDRVRRGAKITFDHIEKQDFDEKGLPYGWAVVKVTRGENPEDSVETDSALLALKGQKVGKTYSWWVEDVFPNYKPSTYVPSTKPADDGHGHAH